MTRLDADLDRFLPLIRSGIALDLRSAALTLAQSGRLSVHWIPSDHVPDTNWLPLGKHPTAALRHLVTLRVLRADAVLEGMPHPSGANAERISYFLGQKPKAELSYQTRPGPIDLARETLLGQVSRMARL